MRFTISPIRALRAAGVFALSASVVLPAEASTVRYRTDAELIALADRAVHARVLRQRTERPRPDGPIYTVSTLAVLEDLTAVEGDVVEVWELGGVFEGEAMYVGGGVTYTPGAEVLVFLERGRYGLRSLAMGFSKFDVEPGVRNRPSRLRRNLEDTSVVGGVPQPVERTLEEFRQLARQVRGVIPRRNVAADLLAADEVEGRDSFTLLGSGFRWVEADSATPVRWYKNTSAPPPLLTGDAVSEIQTALSAWTAPPGASIILEYGGTTLQWDADGPWSGIPSNSGVISFEDPFNEISGSTLAIGGGWGASGGGVVNGTTFYRFIRGYVIFQNAADLSASFRQSLNFARVLQHEIGHGIGLGHTQTNGSVANAQANIMYPTCCSSSTPVPPALGADDLAGLTFIYPAAQACTFALSPTSATFGASGGSGSFSVQTQPGCGWSAASNSGFVALTSGTSGSGSGTVTYTVTANAAATTRVATVTAAAQTFTITQAANAQPAQLVSPAPGSTLGGRTETFTWGGGVNVTAYWLDVGTVRGGYDIFEGYVGAATSRTVTGLPRDGRTVWVRLRSLINGAYQALDFQYQTVASTPARIVSPAPGSTLGHVQTFTWDAGVDTEFFWVNVGSTQGGYEYYSNFVGATQAVTVAGLPTDGRAIWVRLLSYIDGTYRSVDHQFTASTGMAAQITLPAPGTRLAGTTQTFSWSGGVGAQFYWVNVGRTQGGYEIYSNYVGTSQALTLSGLPADGGAVWVRLMSYINGAYRYVDHQFLAAVPGPARITSPGPGGTLTGSTQMFTWSEGIGAQFYWINVGAVQGGYEYYSNFVGTAQAVIVSGLPTDGRPVWVRLFSYIDGRYQFVDHRFAAASPAPAQILTPAPGSTLSSPTATFTWNEGVAVQFFWVNVGTVQGGYDLYSNYVGTSRTLTVSGLPAGEIWVRLYSFVNGAYEFVDHRFTRSP